MIDEGYVKFKSDWRRTAPLADNEVEQLIRWRRSLYAAGLVGHYDDIGVGYGNLSRRSSGDGLFVISGTQTGHLAELGPEHFALVTGVDIAHNRVSSRGPIEASSESMTHAVLYDVDERIGGVVHVHSPRLWESLMDRLPTTDPQVPYGTPEMAEEIRRLYRQSDFAMTGVAVMAGHEAGLMSVGETVAEASARILALAAA